MASKYDRPQKIPYQFNQTIFPPQRSFEAIYIQTNDLQWSPYLV